MPLKSFRRFLEKKKRETGNPGVGSRTDVGFPSFRKGVESPAEPPPGTQWCLEQTPDEEG